MSSIIAVLLLSLLRLFSFSCTLLSLYQICKRLKRGLGKVSIRSPACLDCFVCTIDFSHQRSSDTYSSIFNSKLSPDTSFLSSKSAPCVLVRRLCHLHRLGGTAYLRHRGWGRGEVLWLERVWPAGHREHRRSVPPGGCPRCGELLFLE